MCTELEMMRQDAARIRQDLSQAKTKAHERKFGGDRRGSRRSGDLVAYLQRRVDRLSAEMARHVAAHKCE